MRAKACSLQLLGSVLLLTAGVASGCAGEDAVVGSSPEENGPASSPPAGAPAQAAGSDTSGGAPQAGASASDGSGPATGITDGTAGVPAEAPADGCATFDGSFAAIQKVIFEGHGCTAGTCHGEAKSGGLDLRPDAAYANLVDVASTNSKHARVQPGSATESFLYEKLRAATEPGSVDINGSPMPVSAAPLSKDELAAVKLWIFKGAPQTGSVSDAVAHIDVGSLLDACLPPAKAMPVKPLTAPPAEEGIQFILPPYALAAGAEVENCVPFAYDFTSKVPAQYKDEARNVMFVKSSHVRQDPVSHHMVVWNPGTALTTIMPSDPEWTCRGGAQAGVHCDATKGSADCGAEGVCAGPMTNGTLCGIDTSSITSDNPDPAAALSVLWELFASGGLPAQLANTQSPQEYLPPIDGVYWEIPLRGVLWFNSHAFNLTDEETTLNARMNFYYAQDRKRQMVPHNEVRNEVPVGQAPFTTKTYCATYEVPQNNSIAIMAGHTHRRGQRFWVTDAAGKQVYENFVYNDPAYTRYDPWLEFPAADPAQRSLEFCATFNNGLKEDGSPDLDLVTRASRMPERTSCTPVACVAGKVMAACTTDADCDTAMGAGDGSCDACPITGGVTTENEMFVLMPWLILPAQ